MTFEVNHLPTRRSKIKISSRRRKIQQKEHFHIMSLIFISILLPDERVEFFFSFPPLCTKKGKKINKSSSEFPDKNNYQKLDISENMRQVVLMQRQAFCMTCLYTKLLSFSMLPLGIVFFFMISLVSHEKVDFLLPHLLKMEGNHLKKTIIFTLDFYLLMPLYLYRLFKGFMNLSEMFVLWTFWFSYIFCFITVIFQKSMIDWAVCLLPYFPLPVTTAILQPAPFPLPYSEQYMSGLLAPWAVFVNQGASA